MKLYYAREACSLSDHIALLEAGMTFTVEAVDIETKFTATGADFRAINPKGYVPALILDSGEMLTENIAVLDWIAGQHPALRPDIALSRTRVLEMLTFLSTEIHRAFKPMWHETRPEEKQKARDTAAGLFKFAATQMRGDYLFGDRLSVADCYLYVMLRWADRFDVAVPAALIRLQQRMEQRPSVQAALRIEGSPSLSTQHGHILVRENPGQHRFERPIHNDSLAAAYYRLEDGRLVFIHMEVPQEFSGQGIASELARGTFDLLRGSGRKATLVCPFMVSYFNAHPEYADIVEG